MAEDFLFSFPGLFHLLGLPGRLLGDRWVPLPAQNLQE